MPNKPAALDDPLRGKKTGKWTKYGGAIFGLVKQEIIDHWTCQTCGEDYPVELKPFLYEVFRGDFIRICNSCTHTVSHMRGEVTVQRIITVVRHHS